MTITKLALDDVQHSADLRARMEALLAGHKAQTFTAPPPPPEPKHFEETEELEQPTAVVKVVYHHDRRCSTGDLIGAHVVASFADRQ